MERIEDLAHPESPKASYRDVETGGQRYAEVWLPALPLPLFTLRSRLDDAWAVWTGRATAVQWPHQRKVSNVS